MADTKIEKALYGPSTTEVAIGAILGLLVGVLAACVFLVFKPVQSVKALPKEPAKGVIYYVAGSEIAGKATGLPAKLKTLSAGGTASFNEDELNVWSASLGEGHAKPGPDGAPAKKAAPSGFFNATTPNFRIVGDKLQVGFVVTINYFGITFDFVSFATGRFEPGGHGVAFNPDTFYFGSCPLHKLPAATSIIAGRLESAQKVPEEIRAAWTKVSEAVVDHGLLKVTTSP
jgi:hypothetical protein